ncbi:MAG: hypothetical protein J07HQW2_01741 [Haloquadratum walsbyi J07HQW2]|uniref:Uncharacterized protein n=1 Tax=Haloquadratum walsbyi J07HQW2 TaxID=1238425 RepID=U1NEU3_9EURY|nr:MAG: hypothetical protein J07HQW2_01741 [Haloquadratum walsbyi J07HQW2]
MMDIPYKSSVPWCPQLMILSLSDFMRTLSCIVDESHRQAYEMVIETDIDSFGISVLRNIFYSMTFIR